MCGRISLTSSITEIKQHFSLQRGSAVLVPRYNISPKQVVLVIKDHKLEFFNWGVIFTSITGNCNIVINARIETVTEKKLFKRAFAKHRCLVVSNGFFEWKAVKGKKIPYYVTVQDQKILGLAGIVINNHCVILTSAIDPSDEFSCVHHRCPVIINQQNYNKWLDIETPLDQLLDSELRVTPDQFKMVAVSSRVNNPKFDNRYCIKSLV